MGLPVKNNIKCLYYLRKFIWVGWSYSSITIWSWATNEGLGWELFAIASVVVGGTLLTGGKGSILGIIPGILILGIMYTILNFENGLGYVSLTVHWQQVVRGMFLLIVIIIQASITKEKTLS